VSADPEPEHTVVEVGAKRAISATDSNRPISRNLLEVQGRMAVVGFQKLVIAASERLNLTRKTIERLPELR
jgi:hypothetical protein